MVGVTHKINSVQIEIFQRCLRREKERGRERNKERDGESERVRERGGGDSSLVDNWKAGRLRLWFTRC